MRASQSELGFFDGAQCIAGVDEAGRGPLAGPVVAAAVILDPDRPIDGLDDSKKLSERRRDFLSAAIREHALAWSIGICTAQEIDELNILHASMLAMKRAVEGLSRVPDLARVDGNRCPALSCPVEAIVGGDALVKEIGAASIIAKVHRDALMCQLHEMYPQYGFDQHKGYPTRLHVEALMKHGATPEHRRSFAPVRRCLEATTA